MKSQKGGDFIEEKQLVEIIDHKLALRMDLTREYTDTELKSLIGSCIEELEKKIPMMQRMFCSQMFLMKDAEWGLFNRLWKIIR